MRDALTRLDREGERLRHLRRPVDQHVRLREAVERVVDLDGGKLPRVVAEHPVVLQVGGIEVALPLLDRVSARPREQLHETLPLASPSFSPPAGLALRAPLRSRTWLPPSAAPSVVMSWPSTLRWIVSITRSRTVSRYLLGSNASLDAASMSCFASASSSGFTSPAGTGTSVVDLTSSE